MTGIIRACARDRLYILLIIFMVFLNIAASAPVGSKRDVKSKKAAIGTGSAAKISDEGIPAKQRKIEKLFRENRPLAAVFSLSALLAVFLLLLGIAIDAILLSMRISGNVPDIKTHAVQPVRWGLRDVAKVAILFLFFGYMAILIESGLARQFPVLKNNNFRMVLNSSLLDILTIVFIFYFTVGQYGEKLIALGISFKNFAKNLFYGIVGYIALLPILFFLLLMTAAISNLFGYIPPKQPVVELFLKEESARFLLYTGLFAAIVGPIIEELFFRGFMYNALKKYIGILGSMLVTAAIFALLHANVAGFLPIMAIGLLLVYMYEKTGTLVSSITVHIAHNLGMVILLFLVKQVGV
ncbi:MAG: CPBP family intramembrane metalloprotease [Candidatus Omnitrophota bacterium]|nr:CPBP family intramembrane metalloprotease [Candidatus Omnitrophota bacterium]